MSIHLFPTPQPPPQPPPQPLHPTVNKKEKEPTQTIPTIRQLAPLRRIRNPVQTLLQRIVLRELARIVRVRVRRAGRGGGGGRRGFVLGGDGDADADADADEGEETDYGACDLFDCDCGCGDVDVDGRVGVTAGGVAVGW